MKKVLIVTLLSLSGLLVLAPAQADTGHHFTFGSPGKPAEVTRTIHVEASDAMRLTFDRMDIHPGDVVRFVVTNTGKVAHEFGIEDERGQVEHAKAMMAMPNMQHDDPNVISLQPGETKTLIWRFTRMTEHKLVFACNVPGHYQAGMVQRVTVK
jgi:uncharacterized cupredoxin-like copper-binding protein